ncbi:sigma factor-like helix-turn-helix DNA-binding protein [Bailinhaonella thermotolerans]|uniref:RNA polymerase sigma factor 70 region 4 type 2 domain-containing protein n=1 Tax=Bailinhaonella thermotolerans TaxID=1070861 RepID=A0A3A4AEE2_9ACTN|nr:sigma factor-like helix-turn-helix DNA-binding protein [Bailinhaonella thermotolerans]RJL25127.1 hypothetical protein D5H75_27705 [Bailinhaonella thermotolerans]
MALFTHARREIDKHAPVSGPPAPPPADPAAEIVERVVRELRPHQREVLLLSEAYGFAPADLAKVLDVAADTAAQLADRARRHFEQALTTALISAETDDAAIRLADTLLTSGLGWVLAVLPVPPLPPDLRERVLNEVSGPAGSPLPAKRLDLAPSPDPVTPPAADAMTEPIPKYRGPVLAAPVPLSSPAPEKDAEQDSARDSARDSAPEDRAGTPTSAAPAGHPETRGGRHARPADETRRPSAEQSRDDAPGARAATGGGDVTAGGAGRSPAPADATDETAAESSTAGPDALRPTAGGLAIPHDAGSASRLGGGEPGAESQDHGEGDRTRDADEATGDDAKARPETDAAGADGTADTRLGATPDGETSATGADATESGHTGASEPATASAAGAAGAAGPEAANARSDAGATVSTGSAVSTASAVSTTSAGASESTESTESARVTESAPSEETAGAEGAGAGADGVLAQPIDEASYILPLAEPDDGDAGVRLTDDGVVPAAPSPAGRSAPEGPARERGQAGSGDGDTAGETARAGVLPGGETRPDAGGEAETGPTSETVASATAAAEPATEVAVPGDAASEIATSGSAASEATGAEAGASGTVAEPAHVRVSRRAAPVRGRRRRAAARPHPGRPGDQHHDWIWEVIGLVLCGVIVALIVLILS